MGMNNSGYGYNTKKQPIHTMFTQNQTSGGYNWLDGWGNYYLNFDDGGQDNGEGCVAMKSNGKWNDTVCSDSHVSVCKKTDRKCENN